MGLDISKLRDLQKNIKKKAGQGDGVFLYSNKLTPEGTDIRLLPPLPNMNGIYFLEQTGWWINGVFVIVDEDNDPIDQEIEEARASKDKSLIALLDKKKDKMNLIKKETRYLLSILVLNVTYNKYDEPERVEVDDAKILICKPTLLTEINTLVTSRHYQNGTKNGIADRVKGWNITLSKEGQGLDTKYRAIGWTTQMEMEEKYYEEDKIPDIIKVHRKAMKSIEYQRSVIRNYLYGEDILDDETEDDDTPQAPVKKASKPKRSIVEDEDDDDYVPQKPVKKAKKSIADDEDEDDVPPKKTLKRRRVEEDDEEEEDERPVKKAKSTRSVIDDAADDMSDLD